MSFWNDKNAQRQSSEAFRRTRQTFRDGPVSGIRSGGKRKRGFNRTRAGKNSGLMGSLSGMRMGCTCCDYYGTKERRQVRRKENAMWRQEIERENEMNAVHVDDKETDVHWQGTLNDFHNDELGNANTFGWFAVFFDDRVILETDSYGFVWKSTFDTDLEVHAAWQELMSQWAEYDMSECTEECECGEFC